MPELKKRIALPKDRYYQTHLSIINALLPIKLTPMEIEVLAAFLSLEGLVTQYRFSTAGRKIVKSKLNLSTAGLSNYIRDLIKKGFLREEESMILFHPNIPLIPNDEKQDYILQIINKDHATT